VSDQLAVYAGQRAWSELEQTAAAFARVRAAMVEEIIKTGPDHVAKRERLIVGCQIIDAVRDALRNVVDNGRVAEAALAEADLLRR